MRARVFRRLDQLAQDRRDVLGMDRQLERGKAVVAGTRCGSLGVRAAWSGSSTMCSRTTVALAAIASAMILPCVFSASTLGVDQPGVDPAEVEDAAQQDRETDQVGDEDAPQQAARRRSARSGWRLNQRTSVSELADADRFERLGGARGLGREAFGKLVVAPLVARVAAQPARGRAHGRPRAIDGLARRCLEGSGRHPQQRRPPRPRRASASLANGGGAYSSLRSLSSAITPPRLKLP